MTSLQNRYLHAMNHKQQSCIGQIGLFGERFAGPLTGKQLHLEGPRGELAEHARPGPVENAIGDTVAAADAGKPEPRLATFNKQVAAECPDGRALLAEVKARTAEFNVWILTAEGQAELARMKAERGTPK